MTRRRSFPWRNYRTEDLLDLRLCDLGVSIEGTWIEECVERLHRQLEARHLRVRPHVWISDEWFSPDGIPGIAIPFYLTHPRLKRLEREMMLDVEGGTRDECMKILRHEAGHAVQHAYQLQRKRRWQKIFGRSSEPYPDYYWPQPKSKRFVQHLDAWYAQSHPDEDFAETFAVWLGPRARWRRRYAGWPALRKLEYVDELMEELHDEKPKVLRRRTHATVRSMRVTLREHYRQKRERYEADYEETYDRDLRRLFRPSGRSHRETAAAFVRRYRREIRDLVCEWTGQHAFTVDQVLKDLIRRCRELKLKASRPERQLKLDLAVFLTVHTMQTLYRGPGWHPL
jgi:hypothetical protein